MAFKASALPDASLHGLFEDENTFASTNAIAIHCEQKKVNVKLVMVGTDQFEYCFALASPYAGTVKVHLFALVRKGGQWQLFLNAGLKDCFADGLNFKPNGKHVDIYDHHDELLLKVRHPTPPPKNGTLPLLSRPQNGK